MNDSNAKITARHVDTDIAVIGVGPAGRALRERVDNCGYLRWRERDLNP
jgi:hypothetical protein